METVEVLKPEEVAESLILAIERARKRLSAKIKRKRKKLVKFVQGLGEDFEVLIQKWSASFATVSLTVGIFLTSALPVTYASIPKFEIRETALAFTEKENLRQKILEYLNSLGRKRRVNPQLLANLISQITRLSVKATLDGKELPTVYGEMATEKHLKIYPGESLSNHLSNPEDFSKFSWTGISNTSSAWGYFAQDKDLVTPDLVEKEKYYLVIQTFKTENWNRDWPGLKEWYKFRKLLVYNPENGKAVVGVVGDAGPATYTGRAFGGSPEVMDVLGLSEAVTTGNVLVFFLDDVNNSIPLGPVATEQSLASLSRR